MMTDQNEVADLLGLPRKNVDQVDDKLIADLARQSWVKSNGTVIPGDVLAVKLAAIGFYANLSQAFRSLAESSPGDSVTSGLYTYKRLHEKLF